MYSSSSIDDHIYSEPIINIESRHSTFHKSINQHHQSGLVSLERSIETLEKHLKTLNGSERKSNQRSRRSKCRPNFGDALPVRKAVPSNDNEHKTRLPTIVEGLDNALTYVPYQCGDIAKKCKNDWSNDTTDDSLMDLDLDTFLLIDETRGKKKHSKSDTETQCIGIENKAFQSHQEHGDDPINISTHTHAQTHMDDNGNDDIDDRNVHTDNDGDNEHSVNSDDSIENNYKCTNYINSCPDNPYLNIDDIVDYQQCDHRRTYQSTEKPLPIYMKNINDQINQQNTKDILEDIRDKLAVLLKPNYNFDADSSNDSEPTQQSPNINAKSILLRRNITALKQDVDNYLLIMNQHNEMQIQAFCAGLSKNYKLLTMQHAFGNQIRRPRSTTSELGSELYSSQSITGSSSSSHIISYIDYHQSVIKRRRRLKTQHKANSQAKNQTRANPRSSLKRYRGDSMRCSSSSDSNFQMQRRRSNCVCSEVGLDGCHHINWRGDPSECGYVHTNSIGFDIKSILSFLCFPKLYLLCNL